MQKTTRLTWFSLSVPAMLLGCSGTSGEIPQQGSGGTEGNGGSTVTTQGGTVASGGSTSHSSGAQQATGGATSSSTTSSPATGGAEAGGNTASGGKTTQGGTASSGGSKLTSSGNSTSSSSSTGGTQPVGGSQSVGGSKAAGGSSTTGGSKAAGGSSSTGGSKAGGGMPASGGASTSSANPSTGGTTPNGGAASFKCDNLSLAPSTSGVAKPSGAAGGLKVLDWAGFKGAVSYTFDDNTPSQMANYSALKATGAHFTWFVVGSWTPSSQYKSTIADGQEIANHTYSHNSSGSQSDLQQNETYITTNFGVTAASMAAPNCDQSWSSVAPNVVFQNRGPCGGSAATVAPRDSTSPFLLPAYLPATGESSSSLDAAVVSGKWRIYVIHGFDSQGGTYQPVPINNVTTSMSNAVKNGHWAETMSNVGAYWQGQKLISASATTSATWTLPAHFPKNMCVRITTSGGTVTQGGQAVPWDDHGYYQISLDAGSVTIQ